MFNNLSVLSKNWAIKIQFILSVFLATLTFGLILSSFLVPTDVLTQDVSFPEGVGGNDSLDQNNVVNIIFDIAEIFIFICAGIAVLFLVYGGFKWITDNGDGNSAKQGQSIVLNAVIGLVVAGLAFLIVQVAVGLVGAGQTVVNDNTN